MSRFNFAVLVLTQLICLRLEFAAQPQVKELKRGDCDRLRTSGLERRSFERCHGGITAPATDFT